MIDIGEITETIKLYAKHGWVLRRVLLSAQSSAIGGSLTAVIGDVVIERSDFDGLWFTRVSQPGTESWELRRLGGTPYAVVAVIADDADPEEREEALEALARKVRATLARGN